VIDRSKRVSGFIALALMFWYGGTGCLAVSYARSAAAGETTGRQSAQDHACCKARHKTTRKVTKSRLAYQSDRLDFKIGFPASPGPANAMSCCPLTAGSIVTSSRTQTGDQISLSRTNSFSLASSGGNHALPRIPLRLPNQAQSYLLDCVFLI
jgi:hypothetical protein